MATILFEEGESGPSPIQRKQLLCHVVDGMAKVRPQALYAEFPYSISSYDAGFRKVTYAAFANAVNGLALWLYQRLGSGENKNFPTLAYVGPNDLRYNALILAAVKVGYKMLFISPRNSLAANSNLFTLLDCRVMITSSPRPPRVSEIVESSSLRTIEVPGIDALLSEQFPHFPYRKKFATAHTEPLVVLHTSGTTGLPKPIVWTHDYAASFQDWLTREAPAGYENMRNMWTSNRLFNTLPPFHGGCLFVNFLGAIFNQTTVIYPIPGVPPSAQVVADGLKHTKADCILFAPPFVEELAQSPDLLEFFAQNIDSAFFAGGDVSQSAGDKVSSHLKLFTMTGMTEAGALPVLRPMVWETKNWHYLHFHPDAGIEFRHQADDYYEAVIIRSQNVEKTQPVFYVFPELQEWRTKDLYTPHPTNPDLWTYHARADDIIVFLNGEKTNPISMEHHISSHPEIRSVLVLGTHRFQAALLIELAKAESQELSTTERADTIERVWPIIEEANQVCPRHAKIAKSHILFTTTDKPMERAGKGTVQRQPTLNLYAAEIDALYAEAYKLSSSSSPTQIPISQRATETRGNTEDVASVLLALWSRLLSQPKETLSTDLSIFDLADSIIIMQFCNKLEKEQGLRISPAELSHCGTIEEQVEFFKAQNGGASQQTEVSILPLRDGPPVSADMAHTMGDETIAEKTRKHVKPILEELGLTWDDDVEDVLPLYDWGRIMGQRRRPQSWNHRLAFIVKNVGVTKLRLALEKAFARHPITRTLITTLDNQTALHFIIRPSTKWFKLSISEGHKVNTEEDLSRLEYNNPSLDFAAQPGPLVRCMIAEVGENGESGFVLNTQHSTYDGFSILFFLESVDAFLQSETPSLPSLTPYKLFADIYHQHRTSLQADTAIAHFAKQLSGMFVERKAVWPQQRAPEWFKSSDAGWTRPDGTLGNATDRPILDGPNAKGTDGITRNCTIPGIRQMRRVHEISEPVLIKSALALLNTSLNGTNYAQFSYYDAARSWPFLPPWMAEKLPSAVSIAGPTVSCLYNFISVPPNETVGEFLSKISTQQKQDSAHACVPYFRLLSGLSQKDSDHLSLNIRRQVFNWLPGLQATVSGQNPYNEIKQVQQESRSDQGILWNCGLIDKEEFLINATYDDAQLYASEVEDAIETLFGIAKWLCEEGNWEKELKDCPCTRKDY